MQTPEIRIRIRRSLERAIVASPADPTAEDEGSGLHTVRCPLTGVWYDAAAPGAAPFVQPGDFVGVGAIIGLLETMKVFNEVHADLAGTVREILVRRGDLVMAHSPLISIEATTPSGVEGIV